MIVVLHVIDFARRIFLNQKHTKFFKTISKTFMSKTSLQTVFPSWPPPLMSFTVFEAAEKPSLPFGWAVTWWGTSFRLPVFQLGLLLLHSAYFRNISFSFFPSLFLLYTLRNLFPLWTFFCLFYFFFHLPLVCPQKLFNWCTLSFPPFLPEDLSFFPELFYHVLRFLLNYFTPSFLAQSSACFFVSCKVFLTMVSAYRESSKNIWL